MKKSVVFKWFVLTALLFSTMFLVIGITQNYLFKQYYLNKKSDTLKMDMNQYLSLAAEKGTEAASAELYKNNQVWMTKLDEYGRIWDVENYYIEVKLKNESQFNWRIPMYTFAGEFSSAVLSTLKVGDEVIIDTVNIADERLPYHIQTESTGVINLNLANKLHGSQANPAYSHLLTGLYRGTITKTVFPERREYIAFPYQEGDHVWHGKQRAYGSPRNWEAASLCSRIYCGYPCRFTWTAETGIIFKWIILKKK